MNEKYKKKILIISYTFPPVPGVGGRRWAKFSKYLYRKGYDVKVISAELNYEKESYWTKDVDELIKGGNVTFVKVPKSTLAIMPESIMGRPKKFFEKIKYKVCLTYLKLSTKGQYYDRTVLWKKFLIPVVEKHIENGYKTLVATAPPFSFLADLGKLKEKYADIKLIADIRDPWTINKTGYGYDSLPPKRLMFEKGLEKFVAKKYDTIITVYDEVTEYFSQLDDNTECKFVTIRNGFDPEDMMKSEVEYEKSDNILSFVFVGSFYPKAYHNLTEFMVVLSEIKQKHRKLYDKLKFEFYGDVQKDFFHIIADHKQKVIYQGRLPLDDVAKVIKQSNAAMLFLSDDMAYSFSTKFYEYISLKKTILVFSKQGKAGEFIEANDLGFIIPQGNMYKAFLNAIHMIHNGFSVNENFDLSPYNVEYLTEKLEAILFPHE